MGQGLDNLPFSLEKPSKLLNMLWQAPGDMVWRAASPLRSIPSSLAQLCITLAFHSARGEAAGLLRRRKPEGAQLAGCCGVGYF